MKFGIIGFGFVGQATSILETTKQSMIIYDIDPSKCNPPGITLHEFKKSANLIFISVPTPMDKDGSCCTKIIEQVLENLKDCLEKVIIRSTVPVGFCDRYNIAFMPEFLTEKNAMDDFKKMPEWYIGISGNRNDGLFEKLQILLEDARYNQNIQSSTLIRLETKEAEMMKYFRNCFLALKVSFCNEIYSFCKSHDIDYDNMIYNATKDSRIGHSHVMVPGPDARRGFGGTCFPKDVSSLIFQMKNAGTECIVLKSALLRNNTIDRPEMDWTRDSGRAVI